MKTVTFSLPSELLGEATEALLLGDFNNWNPEEAIALTVQKDGKLVADVALETGRTYEYRFLLNDGRWVNDVAAEKYNYNTIFNVENSVITVSEAVIAITATPAKKPAAKKTVATTKAVPAKKSVKAPATSKDNLTKIEGIGPKIAQLLEAEGITNFKELSKATAKNLKAILEAAGNKFSVHNPASWPKQAKLAAAGKFAELEALQKELKGGK